MKTLEELTQQLADIQKKIETLKQAKQQFKVGMWCKNHGYRVARITNMDDDKNIETVLPDGDIWKSWLTSLRPATLTEIQEALKKEAVKKGFEVGVTVDKSKLDYGYHKKILTIHSNETHYDRSSDELVMGSDLIYQKGIWATIIKEQPLMICEYPVKSAIEGVTINHTFYPESSIFKIKEALEVSNVKSVNVGRNGQYKVDLEMIKKIIKLIK